MTNRKALKKLNSAFHYLRPRMQGDTMKGIAPNAEALAGKAIVEAMVRVATEIEIERMLSVKHVQMAEVL